MILLSPPPCFPNLFSFIVSSLAPVANLSPKLVFLPNFVLSYRYRLVFPHNLAFNYRYKL